MSPEELKIIAEGMGYEAEIRQGTFNTLNCYIQAKGEKGINHMYDPTFNDAQCMEIMEKLKMELLRKKKECTVWVGGELTNGESVKGEGKTIREAACKAALEYFKGALCPKA